MFKSYCYMMLKMFVAKRSIMPITKVIFVQRNIYQEILYLFLEISEAKSKVETLTFWKNEVLN